LFFRFDDSYAVLRLVYRETGFKVERIRPLDKIFNTPETK